VGALGEAAPWWWRCRGAEQSTGLSVIYGGTRVRQFRKPAAGLCGDSGTDADCDRGSELAWFCEDDDLGDGEFCACRF
jgi:hypothetical protein